MARNNRNEVVGKYYRLVSPTGEKELFCLPKSGTDNSEIFIPFNSIVKIVGHDKNDVLNMEWFYIEYANKLFQIPKIQVETLFFKVNVKV